MGWSQRGDEGESGMRVLMTGATGFVGRASVLRLQRDGHRIVAWVRSEARARALLGADVELVSASTGAAGLLRAVETCEGVVNLAGEPLIGRRWTPARRAALIDSRVGVTRELTRALRAGVARTTRVLVSASGIGYYGDRAVYQISKRRASVARGGLQARGPVVVGRVERVC